MILQLEDCHDVLDALFSVEATGDEAQKHMNIVPNTKDPLVRQFDYCFLFDHSQGHDRKRPDGLDINGIRKGPTEKARLMRSVEIETAQGILGPFNHSKKLKVGMTQKMAFEETDNFGNVETGPVLPDSKFKEKYDEVDGVVPEEKLVDELKVDLAAKHINSQGNKKVLQDRCREAGIPITKDVPKVVKRLALLESSKVQFKFFGREDGSTWNFGETIQ